MLKRLARALVLLLALVGAAAVAGSLVLLRGGIAATPMPGPIETAAARRLRSLAIPGDARRATNPVPASTEAIADGMAHFADHCASCHANDGSGQTAMGRSLYPKAPDMRAAATQDLTDGELFYIIENGVRFTGMPAWGDGSAENATGSWHLVHFIRHLPRLTREEQGRMEALNPKSAAEWREEEEIRRFLEGDAAEPSPTRVPQPAHKHGGER
jgi:mono/diheme cytochrome c family protein